MAALIKKLISHIPTAGKYGEWYKIGNASRGQEEVIRQYAKEQGFENLRGFASWMKSQEWDYYDVIKVSYQD